MGGEFNRIEGEVNREEAPGADSDSEQPSDPRQNAHCPRDGLGARITLRPESKASLRSPPRHFRVFSRLSHAEVLGGEGEQLIGGWGGSSQSDEWEKLIGWG